MQIKQNRCDTFNLKLKQHKELILHKNLSVKILDYKR